MIKNLTKKTLICPSEKVCRSISSKAKGLMFSRKIVDCSLIFVFDRSQKADLHMMFVFFPIDVLFLNSEKEVLELKERFLPFTYYSPKSMAKYIIELPEGSIRQSRTKIKDKIYFEEK